MLRLRVPRAVLGSALAGAGVALHERQEKLSIYPAPDPEIILLDTPSKLEKHISVARRTVTDACADTHARVQGVISKWIGVENAVESRVKSLVAADEPLTPGILYVGVATLTGSIIARNRLLLTRLTLPPLFFLATLNHFLPKTSHNLSNYFSELEGRYAPALKEKHDIANAHTRMTWEKAKQVTTDGRERLGSGVEMFIVRLQDTTGLKLREALGWGQQMQRAVEIKAEEMKDSLDRVAGQGKDSHGTQ